MSGYVIGLYKFMRIDENLYKKDRLLESRNDIINLKREREEQTKSQQRRSDAVVHKKYLAYGEFDRIGFERVEKFTKFRDISENARAWVGDRQTHLVYSICKNDNENEIFYKDGEFYEWKVDEAVKSDRLFLGITILQMKYSEKEKCSNMGEYLHICREQILNLVNKSKLDVKCTVMGMLGSFGVTILWLADQYTDILHLVTTIRNTDIGNKNGEARSIILSSYTIFARNHESGNNWNERISQIKGESILHLTLKKGAEDIICKKLAELKLDNSSIYHCAGEHDMVIRMDSSKVFGIFNRGNELYYDAEFYKKYILQSNVNLCEIQMIQDRNGGLLEYDIHIDKEENKEDLSLIKVKKQKAICELDDIIVAYKKLRIKFAEIFPSTTGMVDTLDMLFSDYLSKVSSASNELWVDTFSHQFLKILNCILSFCISLRDLNLASEKALISINDLLSDFERQISHIAESNNLVLGTPVCQFRYSGQNNLTLYAYFGIIKNILSDIYKQQEVSRQDEIVPLIVADIVPIIQSTMYIDYKDNRDLSKVITINLPMVALYNPVCYYPYLYHEIFHYVVPKDRYGRNKIIGSLISMEVLLSVLKISLRKNASIKNYELSAMLDDFVENGMLRYIYMFIVKNYNEYIDADIENIDVDNITYKEMRENELVAGAYEGKLFLKWLQWIRADGGESKLNDNLIYRFMNFLYFQKKSIQEELLLWEESNLHIESTKEAKIIIDNFLIQVYAIVENPEPKSALTSFLEIASDWDETACNEACIFVDALKEALADMAMVKMEKMSFPEYLLLFTKTKKDLLIEANEDHKTVQDILRTGMVLDWLHADDFSSGVPIEAIDRMKDDYLRIYCGMFFSNHKANEDGDAGYKKDLLNEAEVWFMYWKNCCLNYLEKYRIYASLFRKLGTYILVTDKEGNSYWNRYAEALRDLGHYIITKKDVEQLEYWKETQRSIEQRIFNLNIEWIHDFQSQCTFSELNSEREKKINEKRDVLYVKSCHIESEKMANTYQMEKYVYCNVVPKWEYTAGSVGEISAIIAGIAESLEFSNQRILGKGGVSSMV